MISVSVTGVELRRLLNLRIKRLEQAIEFLRVEAVTIEKEREVETERAELFLKLFPPGDPQPDIYMFSRGSSAGAIGAPPSLLVAQIRERDDYELDRQDLAFLGLGAHRWAPGHLAHV